MVFYFTSQGAHGEPVTLYMGKDKVENEELIAHGWENDLWFHVDKLSSAHVYLRIPNNVPWQWDTLPESLLEDCAQLVKYNSIEGNKRNNLQVVYTPWSNLKKTGDMVTGQVGFHKDHLVKRVYVKERSNAIINRLNKTKVEKTDVDFYSEKLADQKEKQRLARNEAKERDAKARDEREALRKAAEERDYARIMVEDDMVSNLDRYAQHRTESGEIDVHAAEEDFM